MHHRGDNIIIILLLCIRKKNQTFVILSSILIRRVVLRFFSDHQHEESWGRIRSESNQANSLDRREMYETSSLRKAYSQCSLVFIIL